MLDSYDVPGISRDRDRGGGMIRKGLNGQYREPCERALRICEKLMADQGSFEIVWQTAQVIGSASQSIAALTMWLARGRPVTDSPDGVRGGGRPTVTMNELLHIISEVESVIGKSTSK